MRARRRSPQTLVRRKPPNLNGAAAVYWAARGVLGARAPAYLLAASRPGRAERGGRTLARASWSRRRAGSYQATQLERGAQNGKLSVQWLDGAKWAAASRLPRPTGEGSSRRRDSPLRADESKEEGPRQCRCRIPALPPLRPPPPCTRWLPTGVVVPNVPRKSRRRNALKEAQKQSGTGVDFEGGAGGSISPTFRPNESSNN
ncbi:hypothetical protein MTO96_001476 [Rhipicephalus appendiculatus]